MQPIRTILSLAVLLVIVVVAVNLSCQAADTKNKEHGSSRATKRLMKELKGFYESDSCKNGLFTVELVNDDIYEWNVKYFGFDPDSAMYSSLMRLKERNGTDHVMFHLKYPSNYPFSPPFVRVVYPQIARSDVQSGGAICMEILGEKHWSSAYTIESLMLQITSSIAASEGVVKDKDGKPYTYENAKQQFGAIVQAHQWGNKKPSD